MVTAMKVEVSVSLLERAISRVQGAVKTGSALAAIGCVLVRAERTPDGGRILVSAYNLELGLLATVPATVDREGAALIPARLFSAVVGRMPESVVRLEGRARNRIGFVSGACDLEVAGLSPDEATEMPAIKPDRTFKVSRDVLLSLAAFVEGSIAQETSTSVLASARMRLRGGTLELAATNEKTLARARVAVNAPDADDALVPREAIVAMKRALAENDIDIAVGISESSVSVQAAGIALVARLVSGAYPGIEYVADDVPEFGCDVARARLADAIARADLVCSCVKLTLSGGTLRVSAKSADGGAISESVVVASKDTASLWVSPRYLAETLAAYDCEAIQLRMNDHHLTVIDPNDQTRVRVVAPMRGE